MKSRPLEAINARLFEGNEMAQTITSLNSTNSEVLTSMEELMCNSVETPRNRSTSK